MKSELDQRIGRPLATRLLRVVFGFFLVVVICLTIAQMVIEYRYQENSIRKEFSNIQTSFEQVLAGQMWHLDEQALRSTVKGIIELPVIVGMKITDESGKIIALAGVVDTGNNKVKIGTHVHLQGFAPKDEQVNSWETYRFELLEADFPIIYPVNQQPRILGRATLYSNTSVVFNRVKASFLMLGIKTVVEIALLWLIFKLVFVRLLKKPLAELTTAVERVTLDTLGAVTVSPPTGFRDELGVLAESFNTMLLDLQSEITKRSIADQNLAASEAKLNSILRVAPAGIGLTKGRVFTAVNPTMCDMTGYSSEELLGQQTRLLYLTDEEYLSSGDRLKAQIDQRGMGTTEVAWCRKDGQGVAILLSAAPMVPDEPEGEFTIIATDITDRKKAEVELHNAKERTETILNSIQNGILVIDVETRLITTANPTALAMIGAEKDDIVGSVCHNFICTRQQGACPIMDLGESIDNRETILIRADGGHTAILKTVAPIMLEGRECLLETFIDITDRKQAEVEKEKLEAQLNQAQKMESVGRLAGGVAHDFNNMLGVILGYTELSMERVEPNDPLHANLEKIQGAAQRSADLTRQLLAFARKQTVSPKVIDLNDTIANMLKLLLRLIGEDIDLAWQPSKEVWPVKIDPNQVDQILTNLFVNARDSITDLGKVTIETGNTVLDEVYCRAHAGFVPGEYAMLAVSDTGCGMDEETQAHIFEPFFTTKEMGKGTGLGLATVYGVVKQNNGFINVYSEPGQGTTFKIYLPRHLAKAVPLPEKGPDTPGERGHEKVLLVEDERAILEMITTMLESLGYNVLAAGTPGEAVRLAQKHRGRIDLLLTDVVMPEMNGRDLAKNLLSIYPDIRRLFMSGYTANVIAHHGVLDEGVHFIQKPFTLHALAAKIREALA